MRKLFFSMLLLSACATIPKSEQVQIRAARDLKCDASRIQATALDGSTMRANGCGREVTYREECVTPDTTRCNWVAQGQATSSASATP